MDSKAKANFQRRLLNELNNLRSEGYTIHCDDVVNLSKWQAKIFYDDTTAFGRDLKAIQREDPRIDALLVEIEFPQAWPVTDNPPLFRIVHPRLEYLSGGVSTGGTVQLDAYGPAGSNPNSTKWVVQCKVKGCLDQLKKQLVEKGARVDMKCTQRFYTAEEAKASSNRHILLSSRELPSKAKFKTTLKVNSGAYFDKNIPSGNKVLLPTTVLKTLMDAHIDPPYTFELVTQAKIRSNCGVLEFSAPNGVILLPQSMMQNLLVNEGEDIKLRCVHLPRGTSILLQPHSTKLLEMVDNDKSKMVSLLEWVLPNYATLTMGDTIEVTQHGQVQLLNVIKTEPSQSISIIADPYLDINLDFTPALDYVDPEDSKRNDPLAYGFEKPLQTGGDDSEEEEDSDSDFEDGKGRMIEETVEPGLSQSQVTLCGNCHRSVARKNLQLHETICFRQNALCTKCNGVFKKTDLDHHIKTAHAIVKCECGYESDKSVLATHQETSCPLRLVTCHLCGLQLQSKDLKVHTVQCGAKTIECRFCKKFIITLEYEKHLGNCPRNPANEKKELFVCLFCQANEGDNSQMEEEALIAHLRRHHQGMSNVMCPICVIKSKGATMKSEANLMSHLQIHELQLEQKRRYLNRK